MNPRLLLSASLALGFLTAAFADTHVKGPEPQEISFGSQVTLSDYLVPGKITVFDFYSHYCPPCMALKPAVTKLHETRSDIAVVDVNVNRPAIKGIDWDSPVVKEFGLEDLPQFKVYGTDGKLMADGDAAYSLVTSWLQ